jgi:Protein of unknown function (DUF3107)
MAKKNSNESSNRPTEVKIGVVDGVREIAFETTLSVEEVTTKVEEALSKGTLLSLTDAKEKLIIVASSKISYVEIGEGAERRVGFATN